jgi:exopolysaccharide/PEP-CTERM locus tyrosine autokinase
MAAVSERKRDERFESHFAPKNPFIVTVNDPDSPVAEEYRKLKATVLRMAPQNGKHYTIAVTSSVSGEGKSLTAINLAVSLAQEMDRRVLLIDGDLRRPSLSEYLGVSVHTGLAQCLRGGVPLSSAIVNTDVPGLELLPAGKAVHNPVEVLSAPRMRLLFGEVERLAPERTVIVDTPPVLPFAETQVMSLLVDGVLFIVKEGESTVQEVRDSLELMEGANVLGIVFNGVTDVTVTNRYYHYYRYYAARRHERS